MNKIANVVFAYSPKNDDELELTVGDKIEVIGFEEEGWWKGKLGRRVGVFPSNFVEVVENELPQLGQNTNKLNSIFGAKVSSKNSVSSNSLNTLNNNINTNNITNSSSNNLIMNNPHQQHETDSTNDYPFASANGSSHSTNSLSERRPKPLRGIGYGDVFAAGAKTKPLPADPTTIKPSSAMASERLSTASLSTLQKPIPKKPPPPAPTDGTNGSASDQAPALPPKPSNQFSPFSQHRYPPAAPTASAHEQCAVREQARVIYAYTPSNDDELEMEAGDIINIIDKNIEDAGWWKGELKGKVGVFPDNFVRLIEYPDIPNQDWNNSVRPSVSTCNSIHSNNTSNSGGFSQQQQAVGTEGKIKSVFAGTPKGFSKELESNLEKHSNPASFLSLKRNKLQQQIPSGDSAPVSTSNVDTVTSTPTSVVSATSSMMTPDTNDNHNGHHIGSFESSPGKLNHITANRAKGPSRRPPSNILKKRNQFNELANNHKHEPVDTKEDLPPVSLPVFSPSTTVQPPVNNSSPTSLPPEQHQPVASTNITPSSSSLFEPQSTNDSTSSISMKTSSSANNTIPENQMITPKSSQRTSQTVGQPLENKNKLSSSPSAPPWMVELRKTNAEKKRDPLPPSTAGMIEESIATSTPTVPTTAIAAAPITVTTTAIPTTATTITSTIAATASTTTTAPVVVSTTATNPSNDNVPMKHDRILQQISKNVTNEIIEMKLEIRKLREDFKCIGELKEAIEMIKIELRTCQSATESQRRYIKELVNNLADERKKIAAMQVEIDRNLK